MVAFAEKKYLTVYRFGKKVEQELGKPSVCMPILIFCDHIMMWNHLKSETGWCYKNTFRLFMSVYDCLILVVTTLTSFG